ncbi:hypothetical protein ABBQ38_003518 [Trebouxia sp. C0009 RCD-2024]
MNECHHRFLFIVGQLVRHGGGILQGSTLTDSPTVDIKQLLAILVSFYNMPKGSLRVKEKALEGLGLLFVAHPAALLEPAAVAAMQQALQPSAPIPLKLKVLSNLLELLKSEEEGLKVKQGETSEALQQQAEVGERGTGEAGAGLVVPVQNGEGDSLNLSAGFIQSNWEAVKALALDTTTELHQQPTSPLHDTQSAAQVRRRALEVMEAVLRGGVMPPFSAVSTLFALTTDPNRDVSERALRVLRKEAEKYIEVRSRLATLEGLQAASFFQQGLTQHPPSMQSPPPAGLSEDAGRGMAALYAQLLQPDRNLRASFLRILVRCFDTASDLLSPGSATADPQLLAFCAHVAARLPFKRCDEPYTLMHLINGTISRRAAFVLSAQKATLNTTGAQGPGQPDAHPSTAPFQEGPAEERDTVAAPGGGDGPMQREGGAQQSAVSGAEGAAAETPGEAVRDQGQTAPQKGREGPSGRSRKQSTAGAPGGRAECTASLALTMLLMLKRYLKATYSMSEDRIAAFSPDLPDKRKQEERMPVSVQEGADLPLHHLRLEAPHQPSLWKEQYQLLGFLTQWHWLLYSVRVSSHVTMRSWTLLKCMYLRTSWVLVRRG